jgi:Protein of unknown function (DUF992)
MVRSALASLTIIALVAGATPAVAQGSVQAGVLECRGVGSTGFIVGSIREMECVFKSDYAPPVRYHGVVRKIGLDIGFTEQSLLAWGVLAPTARIGPGDLAGDYAGVSAGAAVVVGATANALVGGSNNTFALQPLSFEGQTGLNAALGVATLELRYGP